jgi:hypothetical protein
MAFLPRFSTPAKIQDFAEDPATQEKMNALWNGNVNRWVEAALIGDIWDLVNYGPRPAFYNPVNTDTPDNSPKLPITWSAFPGRLLALFPNNQEQLTQWADQGVPASMLVTTDLCTGQEIKPRPIPYPPTGPRGWQDEYCEWSVRRDQHGNIVSVMFTCENPEYWFTLWQADPTKVLSLYRQLVNPNAQLNDLCVLDSSGQPVIDPSTNSPIYNPLNIWNSGTQSMDTRGGAVHLTSSPNTLGAEFDLAAAATIPRKDANGNPINDSAALVCCARYGKIGRHSDPTIGQTVNSLINGSDLTQPRATLTDPVGLYIQTPNFANYQTPDNTPAENFWTVVRGSIKDSSDSADIDRILHAVFSVPPEKNYTVSDIRIDGRPILYASQIANTFDMALMATAIQQTGVVQVPISCTQPDKNPKPVVNALQPLNVFTAYRNLEAKTNELELSIPILALQISPGQEIVEVALLLNTSQAPYGAVFTVREGGVTITIRGTQQVGDMVVYCVTVAADHTATIGDRTILANVPGMAATNQAAIGLLTVVAPPTPKPSLHAQLLASRNLRMNSRFTRA